MEDNEEFTQEEMNFTLDCVKMFLKDKSLTYIQIQNNFTAILLSRENLKANIGFVSAVDSKEEEIE